MAYLLYFFLTFLTSVVIWIQTVAPNKFPIFLKDYVWVIYSLSLLAGVFFVEANKIGFSIFRSAWTLRFVAFSINILVFWLLTYFILGEELTTKNILSLVLSIAIILVQVLIK